MQKEQDNQIFTRRLTDAQPELLRFVSLALIARPDDVWDVVQETNYALITHAAEYSPDRPFLPWAIAFAKNKILSYRKRQACDRLVFDEETMDRYSETAVAPGADPEPYSRKVKHLRDCLAKLPSRQRGIINEHYLDGLPLLQIARRERKSESAIRMVAFRAREAIADCMKRLCRLDARRDATPPALGPFEDSLSQVIDSPGRDPGRVAALFGELRADAGKMRVFVEQADVDYLLRQEAQVRNPAPGVRPDRGRAAGRWLRAAAALALLLAGGAFAYGRYLAAKRAVPAAAVAAVPEVTVSAAVPAAVQEETEGETSMRTNLLAREAAAALAVTAAVAPPLVQSAGATDVVSAGTRVVVTPPAASIYWQTAFTNVVPICWDACPKASSAALTASCMNAPAVLTATFPASETNAVWNIPSGTDEDIYTLELRYLDAGGGTLLAVTSRVARVRGANGSAFTVDCAPSVATNTEITAWSRVRRPWATTDNTVIAYDTSWYSTNDISSAVFTAKPLGDATRTVQQGLDASSGYFGWQLVGQGLPVGWYDVTLEFVDVDSTLLYQRVYRSPGGTVYSFR